MIRVFQVSAWKPLANPMRMMTDYVSAEFFEQGVAEQWLREHITATRSAGKGYTFLRGEVYDMESDGEVYIDFGDPWDYEGEWKSPSDDVVLQDDDL